MTTREVFQVLLDAVTGVLFIAMCVLALTYLPKLIWMMLTETLT